MSQEAAVAVVTRVFRQMVIQALRDLQPRFGTDNLLDLVTILPPDQARENRTGSQVNLYLYQVAFNAAWRNQDIPGRSRPNEIAPPALPLNLHYLLSFFGRKDAGQDDLEAHEMLGRVMRKIHDNPVLTDDTLEAAFVDPAGPLPDKDSLRQVERVRFTPITVTTEELFKLWSGFQTPHRLSVAYEASVVLIESRRPARTPLPVLRRGPDDLGPDVSGGLTFPTLEEARLPRRLGVFPGEEIVLAGTNLDGVGNELRLRHMGLNSVITPSGVTIVRRDESTLTFQIPDTTAALLRWPAGPIAVAARLRPRAGDEPNTERFTNEVAFALLPRILTGLADDLAVVPDGLEPPGALVRARISPGVHRGQTTSLLSGSFEFPALPLDSDPAGTVTFAVVDPGRLKNEDGTPVAGLFSRIRVDGVDSLPIDPASVPPRFDDALLLKVS
jgi:Pvc16 N-terminal domain